MSKYYAALLYATMDYAVLPLTGKTPITAHGVKDASKDKDQILHWWTEFPEANIGLAAGASGKMFVDIDPRNGGNDTWMAIQKGYATTEVRTGSGGTHLHFQDPGVRWPKTLGPGVDIQYGNKYVVAPPSVHPDGGKYEFVKQCHIKTLKAQKCPEWLLDLRDVVPVSTNLAVPADERQAWLVDMLDLRQRKSEWWCRCPVHEEREPSFSVNFDRGVFSCLGCGYSGTVVQLLKMVTERGVEVREAAG